MYSILYSVCILYMHKYIPISVNHKHNNNCDCMSVVSAFCVQIGDSVLNESVCLLLSHALYTLSSSIYTRHTDTQGYCLYALCHPTL